MFFLYDKTSLTKKCTNKSGVADLEQLVHIRPKSFEKVFKRQRCP
jgi:hypothetical protein